MSAYSTFAHRWFEEVWNKDDLTAIDMLAHPDAQAYGFPNSESVSGREGFREAARQFRTAFSDINASGNSRRVSTSKSPKGAVSRPLIFPVRTITHQHF